MVFMMGIPLLIRKHLYTELAATAPTSPAFTLIGFAYKILAMFHVFEM